MSNNIQNVKQLGSAESRDSALRPLQGAYGLRTFSALWRTFFLLIFSSVALVLFVLAVIWLGFA